MIDDYGRAFGRHVRSLRRARGLTQQVLAEASGLSADSIRRLEKGDFSPSLDTLRKLCEGLALSPATLFTAFEVGDAGRFDELAAVLRGASDAEVEQVTRVARALQVRP